MSRTALTPFPGMTLSGLPEHGNVPGTLSVDDQPLPPAGASAADPVIAAISSEQSQLLLLAAQLLKFGTVGGLGLVWDTATVYALQPMIGLIGLQPMIGFTATTSAAYLVAATMNWMLNRVWTFRGRGSDVGLLRQWLSFLGANGLGFALNRSTVIFLVWSVPFCRAHLFTALAAGSLAGMCANFNLSRRLVFR